MQGGGGVVGRQKKNPDYNPERARDELIKAVSDFYLNPPSEDMKGREGKTRMKNMELEFGLSLGKIRKLLVTGGVFVFEKNGVELVSEIARLREEGLSDGEIMEKLSIKKSILNDLTPYKKGVYNADFTADGYDYSNVSTEARRKRSQRKREKMKETNAIEIHETEIKGVKGRVDGTVFPGMTNEEIMEERVRLSGASADYNKSKPEGKKSNINMESDGNAVDEEYTPDIGEETLGRKWKSSRTVNGKLIGDFLFYPDLLKTYIFPNGAIARLDNKAVIGVLDAFHEKHIFVIRIAFRKGGICTAEAKEIKRITKGGKLFSGQPKTDYCFSLSDSHDNDVTCIGNLIDNIVITLQNPSHSRIPECSGYYFPDRNCYLAANEAGRIGIRCKEGEEVSFVVDGIELSPEDFASMFSIYEGFELHYAVREPCLVFTNDMTLYPVKMDEASFGDELTKLLIALSDKHEGKFIGKKEVPVFDTMLEDLLKKLNYYHYVNPNQAEKAGSMMIRILKNTGTDSDVFPEYEILKIKEAVRFPWESYLKD